jgi:hypothetical protein
VRFRCTVTCTLSLRGLVGADGYALAALAPKEVTFSGVRTIPLRLVGLRLRRLAARVAARHGAQAEISVTATEAQPPGESVSWSFTVHLRR